MLNVDEFESVFRAADKKAFAYAAPRLERLLVVADVADDALEGYVSAVQRLLEPLTASSPVEWRVHGDGTWSGVEGVLRLVEETQPDAIVTYRNLRSDAWKWAFSLGVYLNALTRGTEKPVFVTPSPHAFPAMSWRDNRTDSVMVVNESLAGDDALVNWGAAVTREGGRLHLTHVEHDAVFARYMDAISKIPEIDTETARETLLAHLLKEPREWIDTAAAALLAAGVRVDVAAHVVQGHRVSDYRDLVAEHDVDLLVFPTLEEDVIALHGVAYSLAVELIETPLLMI